MSRHHIRIEQRMDRNAWGLWMITHGQGPDDIWCFEHVELKQKKGDRWGELPKPTLLIEEEWLTALAQELIEKGFVKKAIDAYPENAAIKHHLEDMRKLNDRLMRMVEEKL